MIVDIDQIPAEGLDLHFCEAKDFLDPSGERVHLLRPLEAFLHFCRTPTGIQVQGQISSDVQLHCSRCTELFALPVQEAFEVRYRDVLGGSADGERELGSGELDVSFLDGDEISVAGLVRENVLLALPVQPLCTDGCRGLCPSCGINLNKETCSCYSTGLDPRWRKLKSLL